MTEVKTLTPLPKWCKHGATPSNTTVSDFLRALTQYLISVENLENDHGLGQAHISLDPTKYTARSNGNQPYVEPAVPTLPTNLNLTGTAEERARQDRQNKVEWKNHKTRMDAKVETLHLIEAGGDAQMYLSQFWDEDLGFRSSDVQAMCTHLRDTYVKPDENDLRKVRMTLHEYSYNGGAANPAIRAIEFAASKYPTTTPMPDWEKCQILHEKLMDYPPMIKSCIKWTKKPTADKTWTNCKVFFIEAAKELEIEGSAAAYGFKAHFAEQQSVLRDLTNKVDATKTEMTNLAKANGDKDKMISDLRKQLNDLQKSTGRGRGGYQRRQQQQQEQPFAPNPRRATVQPGPDAPGHYCFTHGYDCGHSSRDCESKGQNHQDFANKRDPMGGNPAYFQA